MNTSTTTAHEFHFGTDETPSLHLRAHHADVRIAHDAGPGEVTVRVQSATSFDPAVIDTRTQGRDVFVTVPQQLNQDDRGFGFALQLGRLSWSLGSSRVDIEVHLSPDADLDVHVEGGDITCEGGSGRAELQTGGGDIRVADARWAHAVTQGGDISAGTIDSAELRTGGGDIRVSRIGEGSVKTGGGDVRVDDLGSGRIETGGGDIGVLRAGGDLAVSTGGGDVNLLHCPGETDVRTGAGDVTVEAVSGSVNVKTGAGDIRITVPPEVPVWQDLHSSFGEVVSRIGSRGEPLEGQPYIRITARTGTGDVVLS